VDVALAVDFVTMAVQRQFDVGIMMSGDSDLATALEFVAGLATAGGPRAELAAWRGSRRSIPVVVVPGQRLWCHWLDARAYAAVADLTDYRRPTAST
jgi:hypothetical protein